jgi:hypothetical protein
MKKITRIEDAEPREIQRADVPPADGYTLVVDGHFKNSYDDESAAQKAGSELLKKFPMLQVKIYDAATKTRAPLR